MPSAKSSEATPAGFWARLAAFVVDWVLVTGTVGCPLGLFAMLVGAGAAARGGGVVGAVSPVIVMAALFLVTAYICYPVFMWSWRGWTLGKYAVGLRVVGRDGQPPSLPRAALRMVGYLLSAAPLGLGFVWIVFDARREGWHDKLAGTRVLSTL